MDTARCPECKADVRRDAIHPCPGRDVDALDAAIRRTLDGTLGLFFDLCIAKRVRGCTVAGHEFVFDLPPLPEKPRDPDAPPPDGNMPTRMEIDDMVRRLNQGATK